MSGFLPFLVMILIYGLIGSLASNARNAAKNGSGAAGRKKQAPAAGIQEPAASPDASVYGHEAVMQPTVKVPETYNTPFGHDDSIYTGSMNAVTGEGYDPCHDEQMRSMPSPAAAEIQPVPSPESALKLSWTGDEIVRGFIISEVLNRK